MYNATTKLTKAGMNRILPSVKNNSYYREVYLKSDHWKFLREEKLAVNALCEDCGSDVNLDVHHENYRGLYDVKLTDLKTLCRKCHDNIHKKKKKKSSKKRILKQPKVKWHREGYDKPIHLSPKNKERQKIFDKTFKWKYKDMNTYISIHY